MLKRILGSIIALSVIVAVGIFWLKPDLHGQSRLKNFSDSVGLEERVAPITEILPAPLRRHSNLTRIADKLQSQAVVELTNQERLKQGLPALKVNALLTKAAELKLSDMVTGQYFEHVSPSGVGPSDLAKKVNYEYVVVGENLAEGDFTSDADLVKGWMDSPGHRANILNTKYEEIGIAVRKAKLFGNDVWIGVQEFGKPLSACPGVDDALKLRIDTNQKEADQLEAEVTQLAKDLEQAKINGQIEFYNTQVPIYNQKINSYNTLVETLKQDVENYNTQVKKFNLCINS
jgi:uncharacterized protein YkwD